jgi:acyl carrier protein
MNISEEVIEGLKKIVKNKEVTLNSSIKDLGLDSLDVVDLLMEMEEKYSIEFSNDEMLSFTKVQDIVTAIEKKIK